MKTLLLVALLLSNCSGGAQEKKGTAVTTEKEKMEIFDKERFDKNKVDGAYTFTLRDGTLVRQWETPPEYYVEKSGKEDSPFENYKEFHYANGSLKSRGQLFYNFPVGIWEAYDEKGELTDEDDTDGRYRFSIRDLEKTMREMGVDIMKRTPGVHVMRTDTGPPVYTVSYPVDPASPYDLYKVKIDGRTGRVIEKTTGQVKK